MCLKRSSLMRSCASARARGSSIRWGMVWRTAAVPVVRRF